MNECKAEQISPGAIKRTNGGPSLLRASAEGQAPLSHPSLATRWGAGLGVAGIGFGFLFPIRGPGKGGQIAKGRGGGRHALDSEVAAAAWPRLILDSVSHSGTHGPNSLGTDAGRSPHTSLLGLDCCVPPQLMPTAAGPLPSPAGHPETALHPEKNNIPWSDSKESLWGLEAALPWPWLRLPCGFSFFKEHIRAQPSSL